LLDWLDTNLRGRPDRIARTDVLTNLALVPMALFLHAVSLRLGFDRLAVLLTGLVALLFVVRTTVNLRTLHGALGRLHRTVVEERETLATLFLHSGEGIYTVDDRLRITAINPAMATLLDQPAQLVAGRACVQVCHFLDEAGQELCPMRCPLRQAQAHGQPVSQEVVYAPPGRPPKHLLLTYAAAGDPGGHLRLGIGIARDVSVQKEAERLRRDFVSLVTHELRSPLTISIGYVSMLRRALQATSLDERVWRYLDRIEGAEQHLLRLVNSLLEMARLQRTDLPLEYHRVAVDHLVEDAVEAITATAEAKGLVLERDIPAGLPRLWSSTLYLQEIVNNLLDNAVKYTPEGGRVSVTVQVGPAPAPSDAVAGDAEAQVSETVPLDATALPWLHITVADTGYGISEADLDRLFTQFFRSNEPEVRREPGTGLGLAFTKQMVDRIGGSINVRSTRGAGSTFTAAFPLLSPEQSTPIAT
ncbi:MAG: PAS domain-containing sensor histidine kinase, partial [Chloroflexota bacterium]|nr:PAS domain-containing sensor histidine kinase [Chloroflexota bacterium]